MNSLFEKEVVTNNDEKNTYSNMTAILPLNFNVEIYRKLNNDISHLNNDDLVTHYLLNGFFEKRCYFPILPNNFDVNVYKFLNCDLENLSDDDLKIHYCITGKNEKRKYNFDDINIFVYCCGKAGSTSLYDTFKFYGYNSLHLHENEYFQNITNSKLTIFDIITYNSTIHSNIIIIDSYRNPIERKISSFFQNITKNCPNYINMSICEIINHFNDLFLYVEEEYQSINEVMNYFKIPLFKTFDIKKGYNLIKHNNISFIKLRFCDINNWNNILTELFEKTILVKNGNLSTEKKYNDLYNLFLINYKLPNTYFNDFLLNNKEFKIYNTSEEQNEYYCKWKIKLCDHKTPIPIDFNTILYKNNNEHNYNLENMDDYDLKIHYLTFGIQHHLKYN